MPTTSRVASPSGGGSCSGLLAAGTVGVVAGARIQGWLEDAVAPIVSKDGTGLSSLLPIGRFRIYTVTGGLPSLDKADYTLKVRGLVNTPTTFTYADLRAMTPTALTRDFQCVTGWRVSDVQWRGVKLRDVLDAVGVADDAGAVRFYSFDGAYSESLTLEQARRNDVIARLRARRQGALGRARRAGPALRRADVRIQVDQVAGRHRAREERRAGLLGAAGLRRRRVGRPLQRSRRRRHMSGRTQPTVLEERERLNATLVRFDRTERIVHWVTATLVITLMLTGAAMYAGPVSTLVGRRVLVRNIHVIAGLALPVPIVLALLARRAGAALARRHPRAQPPHAQVQPRPADQRVVPRRRRSGAARHRDHAEVARPVLRRPAHRRDLRARLVRDRRVARDPRSHRVRAS